MIGWIIFGSILLILIIILSLSVTVTAIYDADPEVRIKILCFTVLKIPADPKTLEKKKLRQKKKEERERKKLEKQQKKAARKKPEKVKTGTDSAAEAGSEPAEKTADDAAEKPAENTTEQSNAAETVKKRREKVKAPKNKLNISPDMIMDYVRSASPPIKRLFKKIRIRDVYIDWVVGSDEAGKTAVKYGGLCTAFYSLQEWLTTYFDCKIKEINIEADFQAEKDDIFIYAVWKLRIGAALGCVLWLGIRVLKTFLKYNKKPQAHKVKMKPAAGRGR